MKRTAKRRTGEEIYQFPFVYRSGLELTRAVHKYSPTAIKEDDSISSTIIDEAQLKDALKAAILEILEERKDLVRDLVEEALEDIALTRAIEEGEQRELVSRDEIFKTLEGNH